MYGRNIQNFNTVWHNRSVRNRFIYQIGVLDSPNCLYCNEEENITYAFLFCPCIKWFWNEGETFARDLEYDSTHMENIDKVMGRGQQDDANERFDIIIMIAKHYLLI